jgi:hypothetical protein
MIITVIPVKETLTIIRYRALEGTFLSSNPILFYNCGLDRKILVLWITRLIIKNNTYYIMDIIHKIFIVGRSNAINIAERLGLPSVVIDTARKLYGSSSAEIDEVFLIYQTCIYYLLTVLHDTLSTSYPFMIFLLRIWLH